MYLSHVSVNGNTLERSHLSFSRSSKIASRLLLRQQDRQDEMSEQIAIVAIAVPAPGKLNRVRCTTIVCRKISDSMNKFKEVTAKAIEWIQQNEPGTLQFEMSEAQTDEGTKITLFERSVCQWHTDMTVQLIKATGTKTRKRLTAMRARATTSRSSRV